MYASVICSMSEPPCCKPGHRNSLEFQPIFAHHLAGEIGDMVIPIPDLCPWPYKCVHKSGMKTLAMSCI